MLNVKDTTMAETSNPASQFCLVLHSKKSKKTKDSVSKSIGKEIAVNHTFHYSIQILMNANITGTKSMHKSTYNPMLKMKMLLTMMVELDPGLTITTLDGKSTLIIRKDTFPVTEMAFKKSFSCKWNESNTSTSESSIQQV